MRRVLIESPYGSPDRAVVVRNECYVRACMADAFARGEAPFASHALYTLPGVLRDHDPAERRLGIEAGLVWGACAELTAVYVDLGITPGMQTGINRARKEGRLVVARRIHPWVTDDVRDLVARAMSEDCPTCAPGEICACITPEGLDCYCVKAMPNHLQYDTYCAECRRERDIGLANAAAHDCIQFALPDREFVLGRLG